MMEIQGKSILVQVSARFELARVRIIKTGVDCISNHKLTITIISYVESKPLSDVVIINNLSLFGSIWMIIASPEKEEDE